MSLTHAQKELLQVIQHMTAEWGVAEMEQFHALWGKEISRRKQPALLQQPTTTKE